MEDLAFEIRRKLVHICSVVYILVYYLLDKFYNQRVALFVLVFILICLSYVEFLKMKYNKKIPLFHRFYRENERASLSGSIFLMIGIIISFAIFQFNIAVTAILMMIFGDTASALIGRFGKHKMGHLNRTWEGFISEFVVDIGFGFIFLTNIPVILIMAVTASVVETFLKPVDDNLAIPIASGFAGQALIVIMRILNIS